MPQAVSSMYKKTGLVWLLEAPNVPALMRSRLPPINPAWTAVKYQAANFSRIDELVDRLQTLHSPMHALEK